MACVIQNRLQRGFWISFLSLKKLLVTERNGEKDKCSQNLLDFFHFYILKSSWGAQLCANDFLGAPETPFGKPSGVNTLTAAIFIRLQ